MLVKPLLIELNNRYAYKLPLLNISMYIWIGDAPIASTELVNRVYLMVLYMYIVSADVPFRVLCYYYILLKRQKECCIVPAMVLFNDVLARSASNFYYLAGMHNW